MDFTREPSTAFRFWYDDYLHAICPRCQKSAKVTYLGLDPILPEIRVECISCSLSDTIKIWQARGFPNGARHGHATGTPTP